jgi:hypothetical protein
VIIMAEMNCDQPEFSDNELRAALKRAGQTARRATFETGRPIVVYRDNQLIGVYQDGHQVILSVDVPADVARPSN